MSARFNFSSGDTTKNCESQWKREWGSFIMFAFVRICRLVYEDGDRMSSLDPTTDKKASILVPRQDVINSIESIQNKFSLHDIWRIKNMNNFSYTWSKSSPFIFCKNDCLILDKSNDLVTNVDIVASIEADHYSIVIELENIKRSCKGPGFWKLNTFLLYQPYYLEIIDSALPNCLDDAKDLSGNRAI